MSARNSRLERERERMCEDLGWVEIHRERERDTHTHTHIHRERERMCVCVFEDLGWVEIHSERKREMGIGLHFGELGCRVTFLTRTFGGCHCFCSRELSNNC